MAKAKQETTTIRKKLQGEVIAKPSEMTLKVRVESKYAHPLYGKIVAEHKNYLVHCEDTEKVELGDIVEIEEGKPVSKNKTFYFTEKVR